MTLILLEGGNGDDDTKGVSVTDMWHVRLNDDDDDHYGHCDCDGHVDYGGGATQNCRISKNNETVCTHQHAYDDDNAIR